jgi:CrcB protein
MCRRWAHAPADLLKRPAVVSPLSGVLGAYRFATLERINISPELRTGILTGGIGTYTTFSTFSLETLNLIENGEMVKAGLYVGGSVVLSIAAAICGAYLSRNLGVFALK